MKHFKCSECVFWCCHVLIPIFFLSIFSTSVQSKCTVNKQDVTCFGSTWKQDLLPIENNSLMKLHISKCTESRTKPTALDINFLRNVSKLKLLSITDCTLTRLPVVNYQINSIEIIDLSNNMIDTSSQFPETLKRFPNLKILNLSNNKLTHFPKAWFNCPNQVEMIIADYNLIAGLSPSLAACFVKLKHLSLKGNQFERLKMPADTRKPSAGMQLNEATGLRLFSEQTGFQGNKRSTSKDDRLFRGRHDYIGIIPQFKSLLTLDLSHNRIKSIDQIPLSQLENLNRLNLSHNNLSSKLPTGQTENECDFGTAPFYINGKSGLIDLDLSSNLGLTRIHNCWTFGLHNLQTLRIGNCSISSIYDSSFEKMKALELLDLSRNKLSSVPKELTVIARSLRWLSLAYNNISQVTAFYLSVLDNLRTLNLSHNQFQNLMAFTISENDNKLSDTIGDFGPSNRDSNTEEPVNLLSQLKQLHELDLSFNDLIKVSATSDLSASIKFDGELQKIDLRGNPSLSQFTDFNSNDITTFLTEFLVDSNLKLQCDCLLVGFLKWIRQRHINVSGRCAKPAPLEHLTISQPKLIMSILNLQSCKVVSASTSIKPPYRLKLSSNANLSLESSQPDDDPMDDGQKKSTNHKRQIDYQKWVITGSNLSLHCQFHSSHPIEGPITIEWQRLKQTPIDSRQVLQHGNSLFQKEEKSERFDTIKYRERIEHLSSNYDSRIKITQMGPIEDETTIVEKLPISDETKNTSPTGKDYSYKYTGSLILKPVFLNDIGRYRCLINGLPTAYLYGQSQLISKEENIKVFTPPQFTSTPTNPMAIIEGETAEITCRAIGNPSPMTSLGRIGSRDFPAARGRRMKMYKDDSSFFITNVSQVDAGNYSCTSRNAAGTIVHNFTLKVQMPATIMNKVPSVLTIKVGDALIIGYKVNGVPTPTVKWFKDGHRIVENDRISFSSAQSMLIIQSTVISDAGLYKISVLNALGGNDAFVSVGIIDVHGNLNHGSASVVTDTSQSTNHDKDLTRMPDYWLSGIIIIVILSILLTSILWITIFFCFSKIIGSKKRRLLLISNSQSRASFDKAQTATTTTSFSHLRLCGTSMFKPLANSSIPMSLTTSTIVTRDHQSQENIDNNTFTDSTKSDFQTPQLFRSYGNNYGNRCLSQPYLLSSGKVSQLSVYSPTNREYNRTVDNCDSGIDSSQVYSETLNSRDVAYQCRHKSKHRTNHNYQNHQKQRKKYMCSNSSIEAVTPSNCDNEDVTLEINNEPVGDDEDFFQRTNQNVRHCTAPLIGGEQGQLTS